jgi:propionyl-CoA carboxylase beta chain
MDMFDHITELYEKKRIAEAGGGNEKNEQQKQKGKLTARERIDLLVDHQTFFELNPFMERKDPASGKGFPGDGVVTGYGKINGRPVYLFSQDFTVFGGTLGEMHAKKIATVMDLAAKNKTPIIGLNDSGGARIQEGVVSLNGYGHVFYRNAIYSGVIPQISVILGPCAGGAVYSPGMTDFVFMAKKTSKMFITGPKVIEAMTGEHVTSENLGGAHIHNSISGNAHFSEATEEELLQKVRNLLSFLPQHCSEMPPAIRTYAEENHDRSVLSELVPTESTRTYDVLRVIEEITDKNSFMEVQKNFAKNIVIGFGRINGYAAAIIANQPKTLAGSLDIDAADKAARFIRFCDSFNMPLITLVDVTGFFPGMKQEHAGLIRHGAKLVYAYAEATVPKITIILRKAYGGAYVALNSKAIGADLVFSWPNAEIAVMGPEGAASILFTKEIEQFHDPEEMRARRIQEYRDKFANPYLAAAEGMVDDVIDPRDTRKILIHALEMLRNKSEKRPERKHGNIPL